MVPWIGSPTGDRGRTLQEARAPHQTAARLARAPRVPLSALVMGVVALLLALSSAAVLEQAGTTAAGPIYSVASVRAAIMHGQSELLNRPLRVRAVVGVCTTWVSRCFDWEPVLVDDRRAAPVPLNWSPTLLTALRHIPLLGHFLPAPQPVRWGARAVYRVSVHLVRGTICGAPPCLRADLLDAAQPAE